MGLYKKGKSMLRKAGAAIKKRYTAKPGGRKSTGGVRVAKMAKDIMYLKSVLNPEKKRNEAVIVDTNVGQVNGNGDGALVLDVTPQVGQGVTFNTRNGASIKLHSSIWQFQLQQQANTISKVRLCMELYQITGEPYTGFTFFNERFIPNYFVGTGFECRDFNSQINPDNYMKGKCIARRYVNISSDSVSNAKSLVDLKIPLKYNKGQGQHIRYSKDTNTVEHGQIYLIVRADRGNMSTLTPSTLAGVPETATQTGVILRATRTDYFYDN